MKTTSCSKIRPLKLMWFWQWNLIVHSWSQHLWWIKSAVMGVFTDLVIYLLLSYRLQWYENSMVVLFGVISTNEWHLLIALDITCNNNQLIVNVALDASKINPLYPDYCTWLTNANGIHSLEGPCNPVVLLWLHGTIKWASSIHRIYL